MTSSSIVNFFQYLSYRTKLAFFFEVQKKHFFAIYLQICCSYLLRVSDHGCKFNFIVPAAQIQLHSNCTLLCNCAKEFNFYKNIKQNFKAETKKLRIQFKPCHNVNKKI